MDAETALRSGCAADADDGDHSTACGPSEGAPTAGIHCARDSLRVGEDSGEEERYDRGRGRRNGWRSTSERRSISDAGPVAERWLRTDRWDLREVVSLSRPPVNEPTATASVRTLKTAQARQWYAYLRNQDCRRAIECRGRSLGVRALVARHERLPEYRTLARTEQDVDTVMRLVWRARCRSRCRSSSALAAAMLIGRAMGRRAKRLERMNLALETGYAPGRHPCGRVFRRRRGEGMAQRKARHGLLEFSIKVQSGGDADGACDWRIRAEALVESQLCVGVRPCMGSVCKPRWVRRR